MTEMIDATAEFRRMREAFRANVYEVFASFGLQQSAALDRRVVESLWDFAPPGIDEIAALSAITDLLDEAGYTTIVLDTAPTGHLLRFLELPGVVLSWVRAFLKLLLKYREVVRASGVAEELIAMSKSIKRVAALLADARACEFVGVSIAERMGLEESVRETIAIGEKGGLPTQIRITAESAPCSCCATSPRSSPRRR